MKTDSPPTPATWLLSQLVIALLVLPLLLFSSQPGFSQERESRRDEVIENPTPEGFSVCWRHGCKELAPVALTLNEWHQVGQIFSAQANSPTQERERMARAIGQLEKLVGPKTGTDKDKGGNFSGLFSQGQMDCVDESINTRTYLKMIQAAGWLHFHKLTEKGAKRGVSQVYFGWPHQAALVEEMESGERFVVDSWFHKNGQPAEIIPLKTWEAGWSPQPPPKHLWLYSGDHETDSWKEETSLEVGPEDLDA
ncbi:MAG: hypothetical protein HQL52_06295 [Magnetococcales bacterium]|nr:hypothetical protein [Magnetococcales bacterium]